jgi:hypothetical protein
MRNTVDVTGGKPIAVSLQSISGVSVINPLVAFYDIHGGKRMFDSFFKRDPNCFMMNDLLRWKPFLKVRSPK